MARLALFPDAGRAQTFAPVGSIFFEALKLLAEVGRAFAFCSLESSSSESEPILNESRLAIFREIVEGGVPGHGFDPPGVFEMESLMP